MQFKCFWHLRKCYFNGAYRWDLFLFRLITLKYVCRCVFTGSKGCTLLSSVRVHLAQCIQLPPTMGRPAHMTTSLAASISYFFFMSLCYCELWKLGLQVRGNIPCNDWDQVYTATCGICGTGQMQGAGMFPAHPGWGGLPINRQDGKQGTSADPELLLKGSLRALPGLVV